MFLYGMRVLGDALKSSSGGVMKAALAKVTNNPVIGFIFGMLVTCLIQSSTATIVLTVGLVGAGFLTFRRSVGIVLGANVGTAITAQIIRLMDVDSGSSSFLYFFKADNLAPLALTIGIILIMFVATDRANHIGTGCMGFGILFMGLIYMSAAVSSMGDTATGILTAFKDNYFLGFLSGVLVTGVIQSSSAVVGILQTMASSVGVQLSAVLPVIIGVNIGDCLTTFLVSRIGARTDQIRTAVVHVIYNIIAAVLIVVALIVLRATGVIPDALWNMQLNSGGVANAHGLLRLVPAVLILPFSGKLADLAEKIVPAKASEGEDADIENNLRELDSRLITSAPLALDQSTHLIRHMADVANHNYEACIDQLFNYDPKRYDRIMQREDLLDKMTDAANRYVVDISPYITADKERQTQNLQIKCLTSFERIGDQAVNVASDVKQLRSEGSEFSAEALRDLKVLSDAVGEVLKLTVEAYKEMDMKKARQVEPLEEVVDSLSEIITARHIKRMADASCGVMNGISFENILASLVRVSDHCSSLAVHILGAMDAKIRGQEHQYVHDLHHSGEGFFKESYQKNLDKYTALLEAPAEEEAAGAAED